MNFTPMFTPFTSSAIPVTNSNLSQFTTPGTKFANVATPGGGTQIVALLNSDDNGVTYLRPIEGNGFSVNLTGNNNQPSNQVISLPLTIPGPGSKSGEQTTPQTLQIQLINATGPDGTTKLMPVSIQHVGQVLQLAYAGNQVPEGLQFQLQQSAVAMDQGSSNSADSPTNNNNDGENNSGVDVMDEQTQSDDTSMPDIKPSLSDIQQAMCNTQQSSSSGGNEHLWQATTVNPIVADYLSQLPSESLPMSLHHFLKFSAETIKRESSIESSPLSLSGTTSTNGAMNDLEIDENGLIKGKKKKKYKKKPPKPRRPRPGQVHIATALDGTLLFCCPECNMAYPEKELLEQHLVAHKIERRFICDICGAGLKRKEHLERHKLGHNPERPYVCEVCAKGFKRKEHLNLHTVIHSGEKTEICGECGKGFYRRDHLRKHTKSHVAKRIREEMQQQQQLQQMQERQHTIIITTPTQQDNTDNVMQQNTLILTQDQDRAIIVPSSRANNSSSVISRCTTILSNEKRSNLIIPDNLTHEEEEELEKQSSVEFTKESLMAIKQEPLI